VLIEVDDGKPRPLTEAAGEGGFAGTSRADNRDALATRNPPVLGYPWT
jgi:hypothetical protein